MLRLTGLAPDYKMWADDVVWFDRELALLPP